MLSTSERT